MAVNQRDDSINFTALPASLDPYTAANPPPGWRLPPVVLGLMAQSGIFLPRTAFTYPELEMARRKGTFWQREKGPLCRVVVATWPDGAERREATSGRVPINAFSSVERGPSGSVGRP